jgi:phage FluMu gp28-like protein
MSKERKLEFHFPKFYKKQKELVFTEEKFVCALAAPQVGKTAALLCYVIYKALSFGPGKSIWWVAPFNSTTLIAWRRLILQVEQNLPKNMYVINQQYRYIDFVGHARIKFVSAENTSGLFGETCDLLCIDEIGLISKESFSALMSRITQTGAPVRCVSNLQGRNWYYQLCQDIKNHKILGAKYIEITIDDAIEAGLVKQETVDLIKSTMPISRFNELYYCIPSDDSANPFGIDHINSCIVDDIDTDNTPIAYGVDLARTYDYTCCLGLSLENMVVKLERFQSSWDLTRKKIISLVDGVSTCIDSTGVGDPITEDLGRVLEQLYPFRFSNKTKTTLIESLIMAIQNHSIKIPRSYTVLIDELKNFGQERNETGYVSYKAMGNGHDDTVIALALALHCKSKYLQTCSLLPSVIGTEDTNYAQEYGWVDWLSP